MKEIRKWNMERTSEMNWREDKYWTARIVPLDLYFEMD